jgi:4-amino-4-deoxy-L-arabinose transferase-like glycosyltransferase
MNLKKRKKKVFKWIKDPHRSFIIVLFLVMIAVRIYYFITTMNQAVWWDEGDYLNIARLWAFGSPSWDINPLRPLLFPFIVAGLYKLGATEIVIRLIPFLSSIVAIILTYYIGKEMYNKQVGLIAAFMLSFFWSFLFFSYRMLVDVPVAMLWLLALLFFIRGYEQKKQKYLWFFLPIVVLAFLTKFTGALLAIIVLVYLVIVDRLKPLKNKDLWITVGLGIVTAIPFLWYEFKKFGHPLAFYIKAIGGRAASPRTGWQTLQDYITTTLPLIKPAFLILFIIGFALIIFELIIGLDLLLKNKEKKLRSNLLLFLTFLVPFIYIVSIGYGAYIEERYLFLMYPLMFIICAKGLLSIFHHTKKYNKSIAIAVLVIFLTLGFYQNVAEGDMTINNKKTSFIQVKEAGEWIKEHSQPDDLIYSHHTQAEMQYHSERRVSGMPGTTPEEFIEAMKRDKPKYLVMNVFANLDPNLQWKIPFPYINEHIFKPEVSYGPYLNEQETLPTLTVFSINPVIYEGDAEFR